MPVVRRALAAHGSGHGAGGRDGRGPGPPGVFAFVGLFHPVSVPSGTSRTETFFDCRPKVPATTVRMPSGSFFCAGAESDLSMAVFKYEGFHAETAPLTSIFSTLLWPTWAFIAGRIWSEYMPPEVLYRLAWPPTFPLSRR